MQTKKERDRGVEEYVSRIVTPVFERVLQETTKNPVLVGDLGSEAHSYCLYQPHDYRLYFDFCKTNFNPQNQGLDLGCNDHKVINSSEHCYSFENFNVRVKKTQIQIINNVEHKRWYRIELNSKSEEQILNILNQKDNECKNFLNKFIHFYGGSSEYKILNRYSEDKIKHEDSIDLLPIKMKFRNKVGKKVYNEKNFEFSDPAFASNYLLNRSLESVAPFIVDRLETINPLRTLKQKIKSVNDVFKNQHLITILTPREKGDFSRWLFCLL